MNEKIQNILYKKAESPDLKNLAIAGGVGALGGLVIDRYLMGNKDWKKNLLGGLIGAGVGAGGYAGYHYWPKGKNTVPKTGPSETEKFVAGVVGKLNKTPKPGSGVGRVLFESINPVQWVADFGLLGKDTNPIPGAISAIKNIGFGYGATKGFRDEVTRQANAVREAGKDVEAAVKKAYDRLSGKTENEPSATAGRRSNGKSKQPNQQLEKTPKGATVEEKLKIANRNIRKLKQQVKPSNDFKMSFEDLKNDPDVQAQLRHRETATKNGGTKTESLKLVDPNAPSIARRLLNAASSALSKMKTGAQKTTEAGNAVLRYISKGKIGKTPASKNINASKTPKAAPPKSGPKIPEYKLKVQASLGRKLWRGFKGGVTNKAFLAAQLAEPIVRGVVRWQRGVQDEIDAAKQDPDSIKNLGK